MVNVLDKDKILWYVMRAYKNENTAEDRLSNETYGLEYHTQAESPSHCQGQESLFHGTRHP